MDGLLRDLAQDCPWYNERPRRYEPRCGVRFTDLDHLPPPNHPDQPIYRQRQPSREDVPKPKHVDRFPATYQGGGPTLLNWPDAQIVLTCGVCERRDVFAMEDLRARFDPGMLLTFVRSHLTAECPRRKSQSIYEQCGARLVRP